MSKVQQKLTITEALAEIKTVEKRIQKKREAILPFVFRQEMLRDPHEKDGGSAVVVQQELQAVGDLQERVIAIRRAIQEANSTTDITVGGETRSISDWLVWRREVAPQRQQLYVDIRNAINNMRAQAQQKGLQVVASESGNQSDIVVNVNEKKLAAQIEALEEVLGTLDGQLSLKNATVTIEL